MAKHIGTCKVCHRTNVTLSSLTGGKCHTCTRVVMVIEKIKVEAELTVSDQKHLDIWLANPLSVGGIIYHQLTSNKPIPKGTNGDFPKSQYIPVWTCSDGSEFGSEVDALRRELEIAQAKLKGVERRGISG